MYITAILISNLALMAWANPFLAAKSMTPIERDEQASIDEKLNTILNRLDAIHGLLISHKQDHEASNVGHQLSEESRQAAPEQQHQVLSDSSPGRPLFPSMRDTHQQVLPDDAQPEMRPDGPVNQPQGESNSEGDESFGRPLPAALREAAGKQVSAEHKTEAAETLTPTDEPSTSVPDAGEVSVRVNLPEGNQEGEEPTDLPDNEEPVTLIGE